METIYLAIRPSHVKNMWRRIQTIWLNTSLVTNMFGKWFGIFLNYVENPNSSRTHFRLVCNTSNSHSQTTMSVEQMTPDSVLKNMEAGLIRFQLFSVPLVAYIQGAYWNIAVDAQTALLRLMHYFIDPPSCVLPKCSEEICKLLVRHSPPAVIKISPFNFCKRFTLRLLLTSTSPFVCHKSGDLISTRHLTTIGPNVGWSWWTFLSPQKLYKYE